MAHCEYQSRQAGVATSVLPLPPMTAAAGADCLAIRRHCHTLHMHRWPACRSPHFFAMLQQR